jgi:AraC family transcriptional regulator
MRTDQYCADASQECVRIVQKYINQHLSENLTRQVLSSITGFSVPHLHRIFIATTGESIGCYVRRMRMERAARKLRFGAVDITEVALAAGYASHTAFGKAFRKHFGLTPGEFRQIGCLEAARILRKE